MSCEDCPIRSECEGDLVGLTAKLLEKHHDLLLSLASIGEVLGISIAKAIVTGFVAGYVVRVEEEAEVPVDESVWGELYDKLFGEASDAGDKT